MQILEHSIIGFRSAVVTLKSPGSPLRFMLFPMVHLAEREFYEEVMVRLRSCDLVVAEGMAGRSIPVSVLTLSYRLARHNPRLGLVVQRLDLAALGLPVILPDMTAKEFNRHWKAVPIARRVCLSVLAPLVSTGLLLFGTRELLGRALAMDDLTVFEDERFTGFDDVDAALVIRRDALLVEALTAIQRERSGEPLTVAVVYGAGHVPGVVRALRERHGYRPVSAEWLTVFGYV